MSHPHEYERDDTPRQAARSTFAAPRLELPRFQFAPSTTLARAPEPSRPAPPPAARPSEPVPAWLTTATPAQHAPAAPPTWQATATAMPQPVAVHAPVAAPVPAPAPVYHAPPVTAAQAMANVTSPARVAWTNTPPPDERTLLQRITPVHMGVLLVLVMAMFVMTSGPAAMTAKPSRLPAATVAGSGTAAGVPLPARAGATAVDAATAAGAPKAASKAKVASKAKAAVKATAAPKTTTRARPAARTIRVGSARVRARVRAGGIPSPAAAANLAIAGGGRVHANSTGAVRMAGIPSPAASAQLGPQELPFRPSDGVTLPRMGGERDGHAVDSHYGASTLPMEEPVALPAMTPGAAAAQAQHQATLDQLTGGSSTPPAPPASGYAFAI